LKAQNGDGVPVYDSRTSRRGGGAGAVPYEVPLGCRLRDEDGATVTPKALRSSSSWRFAPWGFPARQGLIHTSLSSRCGAVTVAGPPAATALLQPPLRRWLPAPGPVSTEGFQSLSGSAAPVSWLPRSLIARAPAAAVHQHRHRDTASPVPGRRQHRRSISAFLHNGLVNLFIQSGPSTACPGTGTGSDTASAVCPPTLHRRAYPAQLIEPGASPQRGRVAGVVPLTVHAFAPQPVNH
jgi:hypothetical protein